MLPNNKNSKSTENVEERPCHLRAMWVQGSCATKVHDSKAIWSMEALQQWREAKQKIVQGTSQMKTNHQVGTITKIDAQKTRTLEIDGTKQG